MFIEVTTIHGTVRLPNINQIRYIDKCIDGKYLVSLASNGEPENYFWLDVESSQKLVRVLEELELCV